jgi:tetratricopeptide (TPR) repeat protein
MLRTMRRASSIAPVLALLCALPGIPPCQASAQSHATTAELIASYADWVNGRRTDVAMIALDLDTARRDLGRFDPSALPVDPHATPAQARESRRRLLTAFALELAAVGSKKHAAAAARLVEWACPYVRSHTPVNDFDRAWQLAALAVLEGGVDSQVLHDHLDHIQAMLPDEPRVLLARGIAEEQFGAPAEVLTRTETAAGLARAREALARDEGERFRASERAIARFQEAGAKDASLRAEAALRKGHVLLRMNRYDAALAAWVNVETMTEDRALIFLVHLFRGLAFEGRARIDEARHSYLTALNVSPGAHSATLRLAALAFQHGHGEPPYGLIDALLRDDDPRRDPWWSYYAADWRFWYPRIDRVRAMLREP